MKRSGRVSRPIPLLGVALLATIIVTCPMELAGAQETTAPEWQRSRPDVVVYLPRGGEHRDGDNEMLLVVPFPSGDELLAFWTQSSVEGRGDNRIMLARSPDGRSWSPPKKVVGTSPGSTEPQASWGVPVVTRPGRIYLF